MREARIRHLLPNRCGRHHLVQRRQQSQQLHGAPGWDRPGRHAVQLLRCGCVRGWRHDHHDDDLDDYDHAHRHDHNDDNPDDDDDHDDDAGNDHDDDDYDPDDDDDHDDDAG